ncbi:MAG: helix-turn-helix transcriptional regulator [Pseudomonadota bacterium]
MVQSTSYRLDRRGLARLFRDRLRQLIETRAGSLASFARATGTDRSALSQFLDPELDRLPRAETLRQLAERCGVSADWLLGLSNAAQGGPEVTPSVEIETAIYRDGTSPLDLWRREIEGQKLRYVPATIPDMLNLPEVMDVELDTDRAQARLEHGEAMLDNALLGDVDVEIAMPVQVLETLSHGTGLWSDLSPRLRQRQLGHMAQVVEASYPVLRLHLYDGRSTFSAPFTVFGNVRAAVYLGRSYLVVTAAEEVRALARLFDGLVRQSLVGPDRVHERLAELALAARQSG